MTSEVPSPEEVDEEASFLHRLEMIKDLIEAPDAVSYTHLTLPTILLV